MSKDKAWLNGLVPQIKEFLSSHLGLELHEGKTMICNVYHGVSFLGAFIKLRRSYVSRSTLKRMNGKIELLEETLVSPDAVHLRSSLSSMMGLMRQHSSFNLRSNYVHTRLAPFLQYGSFDKGLTKFIPDDIPENKIHY